MIKYTFCFFSFFFLACPILQAQDYCQIKIPANVDVIRKTPLAERNGLGKTYWICGNARVTFRTGDATLFVEAGCYVSLNAGKYTVYAKDGATIYWGVRCEANIIQEPQARINGGSSINIVNGVQQVTKPVGRICPVLNYDYSEAPDNLCPKLPLREMPPTLPPTAIGDTSVRVPNTLIEIPQDTAVTYDSRYRLPAQTEVINVQKNTYQSNSTVWVCSGVNFWINGDNNRVYIERGAQVTVLGNKNVILLKAGGSLHLPQGGGNELLYEEDTDLKTNRAKKTKFTKLQDIVFRTEAVKGGCK